MGRNTMTWEQKKEIVIASMHAYASAKAVAKTLTGHNTRECNRAIKLINVAHSNVTYWIYRPVFEITNEDNARTANQLHNAWLVFQQECEAKDGSSV